MSENNNLLVLTFIILRKYLGSMIPVFSSPGHNITLLADLKSFKPSTIINTAMHSSLSKNSPDSRMFPAWLYPKFKAQKISANFADPDVCFRRISAEIEGYFHNLLIMAKISPFSY